MPKGVPFDLLSPEGGWGHHPGVVVALFDKSRCSVRVIELNSGETAIGGQVCMVTAC
jgi:hypothetical protein